MRRFRLIVVAALAALLLGTVAAYWLNPPVRVSLKGAGEGEPQQADSRPHLKGLEYTQVKDGVRKWTLSSEMATYDEKSGEVALHNVFLKFFPENGGEVTLRGKTGRYFQKEQVVILTGNVVGQTHDGITLKTDELKYIEKEKKVVSSKRVTVAGARFIVEGIGMTVNIEKNTVSLNKNVNSTFVPVGSGPPPGVMQN